MCLVITCVRACESIYVVHEISILRCENDGLISALCDTINVCSVITCVNMYVSMYVMDEITTSRTSRCSKGGLISVLDARSSLALY